MFPLLPSRPRSLAVPAQHGRSVVYPQRILQIHRSQSDCSHHCSPLFLASFCSCMVRRSLLSVYQLIVLFVKFEIISFLLNFLSFFALHFYQVYAIINSVVGVRRSLVARSAGGREVAGSNPVTPIFCFKKDFWKLIPEVLFCVCAPWARSNGCKSRTCPDSGKCIAEQQGCLSRGRI